MSYVTTHPEALDFAAGKLEGIGTALAAQNAASAASTATCVPLPPTRFRRCRQHSSAPTATCTSKSASKPRQFIRRSSRCSRPVRAPTAPPRPLTRPRPAPAGLAGISPIGQLTQFGQFGLLPGRCSATPAWSCSPGGKISVPRRRTSFRWPRRPTVPVAASVSDGAAVAPPGATAPPVSAAGRCAGAGRHESGFGGRRDVGAAELGRRRRAPAGSARRRG